MHIFGKFFWRIPSLGVRHCQRMADSEIHPSSSKGFLSSDLYDRVRPGYSKEACTFFLGKLGLLEHDSSPSQQAQVLELGAGTGKFTRPMQEALYGRDVNIIASDPVLSMREKFRKIFPGVEIKEFSAEKIDLPDCSMHAVVAAQSFHWFANNESLSQIHRVLVPGGKLGLIWNQRDHSIPWVKELDEQIIYPAYEQSNTPRQQSCKWEKVLDASEKFGPGQSDTTFTSEQTFTVDEFMDRIMSISVIAVKSEREKEEVMDQAKFILSKHKETQGKNAVVLPYNLKMFWYERR